MCYYSIMEIKKKIVTLRMRHISIPIALAPEVMAGAEALLKR